jgi:hypothetical protein
MLYVNNQSCIKIAKNPVIHTITKHIEVYYHFIREKVILGQVEIMYVFTSEQLANILTNPLGKTKFQNFRDRIGVQALSCMQEICKV